MGMDLSPVRLVMEPTGLPVRVVVPDWVARFDAIQRMTGLALQGVTLTTLTDRLLAAVYVASLDEDANRVTAAIGTSGGELQPCGCITFGRVLVDGNRMAALSLSVRDCGAVAIFRLPTAGTPQERVERAVFVLAAACHRFPTDGWAEVARSQMSPFCVPGEQMHWPEAELIRIATPPDDLPNTVAFMPGVGTITHS